jgi:hypothetical protein
MGHLVAQGPTVMLPSLKWTLETLYLGGHSGQLMARHNGPLGGPGPHSHAPVTEVDISVADPTVNWNTDGLVMDEGTVKTPNL